MNDDSNANLKIGDTVDGVNDIGFDEENLGVAEVSPPHNIGLPDHSLDMSSVEEVKESASDNFVPDIVMSDASESDDVGRRNF